MLMRRDGAELQAGSHPCTVDIDRITHKMAFLVASGLPERDAQMAMLASSRFTVGSVLEEQAEVCLPATKENLIDVPEIDHESAFEEGLKLILDGLATRLPHEAVF